MNLKLHEVIALYYELNGLAKQKGNESETILQGALKQKTSLKLKVYLQRLNKVVQDEVKLYDEAKQELFKKYGVEEDGMISIPVENFESFNKEHEELLTAEKEVNVSNLWGSDLTIDNLESIETDEFYPTLIKLIDGK